MRQYTIFLIITLLFFSCKEEEGCMDPSALNYNSDATIDNGSCNYSNTTIENLNIYFTQTINGEPLIINDMIYLNAGNDTYSVQTLRYLISDITPQLRNKYFVR